MRTLLILLLLCWVSSTADGLKCYVCDPTTSSSTCNKNQVTCPASFNTCLTGTITGGNSGFMMQQCSSSLVCNQVQGGFILANNISAAITCCGTDLCNYSNVVIPQSGAATSRLHTLLLALPLCAASALRYLTA